MSPAEQEHYDHVAGSASEFQNAYEEARIAASQSHIKHYQAIADALAAGLFVVVEEAPYYCRATDAIAGSVAALRSAHPNRSEADAACAAIYEKEASYSDGSFYVLPFSIPAPAPVSSDDNVPF